MVPILQVMGLKKSGQDQSEVDGSIATACLSSKIDLLPVRNTEIGGDNVILNCLFETIIHQQVQVQKYKRSILLPV